MNISNDIYIDSIYQKMIESHSKSISTTMYVYMHYKYVYIMRDDLKYVREYLRFLCTMVFKENIRH